MEPLENVEPEEVTRWIRASRQGDAQSRQRVFDFAYHKLKVLARRSRQGRPGDATLDTTSLVHEFFIKYTKAASLEVDDRRHFFNLAAKMMRQIVLNSARKRSAQKRGSGVADHAFFEDMLIEVRSPESLLLVDQLLDELEKTDPEVASAFVCRRYAFMTNDETAEALGVSPSTVKRHVRYANAFLTQRMQLDA